MKAHKTIEDKIILIYSIKILPKYNVIEDERESTLIIVRLFYD